MSIWSRCTPAQLFAMPLLCNASAPYVSCPVGCLLPLHERVEALGGGESDCRTIQDLTSLSCFYLPFRHISAYLLAHADLKRLLTR